MNFYKGIPGWVDQVFFGEKRRDEIHDMGDGQGKESKDTLPSKWMIIFLGLNSFTLGASQKAQDKSHYFFGEDAMMMVSSMRHSVVRRKTPMWWWWTAD